MTDCYFDEFDDEFNGNVLRHISNGETSVNVVRRGNDVVSDEDDYYIGNINDEDIEEYLAECEADAILSSTDYVFSQDD